MPRIGNRERPWKICELIFYHKPLFLLFSEVPIDFEGLQAEVPQSKFGFSKYTFGISANGEGFSEGFSEVLQIETLLISRR